MLACTGANFLNTFLTLASNIGKDVYLCDYIRDYICVENTFRKFEGMGRCGKECGVTTDILMN